MASWCCATAQSAALQQSLFHELLRHRSALVRRGARRISHFDSLWISMMRDAAETAISKWSVCTMSTMLRGRLQSSASAASSQR